METVIQNPSIEFVDHAGVKFTSEEILNKIAGLAVCVTDSHGYFVEVNDNYTKLYGYSEEELVGNHFTMVVPEAGKAYAEQVHNDFIAGQDEMPAIWEVQRKDGEMIKIYVESIRMNDDGNDSGPSKMTVIEMLKK